jgi:Predicted membrane protein (DUF2339)
MDGDLKGRIEELEARVRDLELLLGVKATQESHEPPPAPEVQFFDDIQEHERAPSVTPAAPAPEIFAPAARTPVAATPLPPAPVTTTPPIAPPVAPPVARPAAPPLPPRASLGKNGWNAAGIDSAEPATPFDLERMIGGRWFMFIGALILVIGAGLFLKLAYDRGWLGHVPPGLRCLMGAAFGAALLGAGEVLRRKLGALASVGASAAGLGILYGSTFTAHALYKLISAPTTFILLAAVAALGLAIAGVTSLASLAVLALIGAYLNPLLLHESHGNPAVPPGYLLILLATGLVLSAWRAKPFRVLRPLVWWGTVAIGSLWLLQGPGMDTPWIALAFVGVFWTGIHAELAASGRGQAAPPEGPLPFHAQDLTWERSRFVAVSFSTTSWVAWIAVLAVRQGLAAGTLHGLADWMPPAALGAAAATLALMLAGSLRIVRDVPRTDLERLGAGLMAQAGALLITTVALAVSGWYQAAAWLAIGAAAVLAGRWIRSRGLDVYGLIVLSIGTVRVLTIDAPYAGARRLWLSEAGGLAFSHWTILMLCAAAAWWTAAGLLMTSERRNIEDAEEAGQDGTLAAGLARSSSSAWRWVGDGAGVIGSSLVCSCFLDPHAEGLSIALVWLGLALCIMLVGRRLASLPQMALAFVALGLATLLVATHAPVGHALPKPYFTIAALEVTRWMVMMFAAAGAWIGAAAMLPPDRSASRDDSRPRPAAIAVAIGVLLLYAGFLHPSVPVSVLALVWAGIGVVMVGVHSLRPRLALDALGALGLAAALGAWTWGYPWDWMASKAPALLHPGLLLSFALAAAIGGCGRWIASPRNPSRPTLDPLRHILPAAGALLFVSTSLEVARVAGLATADPTVRRAAVSIWWGLLAVALIAGGFIRPHPYVRYAGLALLAVATLKAVILDLAQVPAAWRIVSFVGLGLLMLGVAAGYSGIARAQRRLDPK